MEYLSNGNLDLGLLNDCYKNELDVIFQRVSKPACIIWDYKTKLKVYSIYTNENLKKSQIKNVTFDDVEELTNPLEAKSIMFFINSSIKMIDKVDMLIGRKLCKECHLVFVPEHLTCHLNYVHQKGLSEKLSSISNFRCLGVPLDNDIISLEDSDYFLDMTDINVLHQMSRLIIQLESLYGEIPVIKGKGVAVPEFVKILEQLEESVAINSSVKPNYKETKIQNMIILDRRIDMLAPLMTQITYESLVDEIFHFDLGFVRVPLFFLNDKAPKSEVTLYQLNSSDSFYGEIRDLPIYESLTKIVQFSQEVKAEREKFLKAKKIDELAEVTRNLKSFLIRESNAQFHLTMGMSLNKYTKMANHTDYVKYQSGFLSQEDLDKPLPFLEDCFMKKAEIEKVVQLICIQSLCAGGLKPKLLNYYKKEIIRTYGLPYLGVIDRLEKMGLLTVQQQTGMMMNLSETTFDTVSQTLNLLPETESICNIYAGYVPIFARLVQYHEKPGWNALGKALSLISGPDVSIDRSFDKFNYSINDASNVNAEKETILVVCLGGITRSEISVLRMLASQEEMNVNILIVTTSIICLPKLLESLTKPHSTKSVNPVVM